MQRIRLDGLGIRRSGHDWPADATRAPRELEILIGEAMIDFGPDGHLDGYNEIAAIAWQWLLDNGYATASVRDEV